MIAKPMAGGQVHGAPAISHPARCTDDQAQDDAAEGAAHAGDEGQQHPEQERKDDHAADDGDDARCAQRAAYRGCLCRGRVIGRR